MQAVVGTILRRRTGSATRTYLKGPTAPLFFQKQQQHPTAACGRRRDFTASRSSGFSATWYSNSPSAIYRGAAPPHPSSPTTLTSKREMSSVNTHESLTIVSTSQAPAAIGPYSQGIIAGDLLFCSGCIPLDPVSMLVVEGGVEAQAEQALKNLKAVVEASGAELGKVVKTTVFLKSMDDFVAVNGIYAKFFGNHKPARSAVEVARLPKDVLVEVEAIVSLK